MIDITDVMKPTPDEKSRAYRVPIGPEWFQERDCVVIKPGENFKRVVEGLKDIEAGNVVTWGSPDLNAKLAELDAAISGR